MPTMGVRAYIIALPIAIKERDVENAWRAYAGECLRLMTENTAKMGGGSYIQAKWADIINPKPTDNRTGEEIVADVIKNAGLTLITSGKEEPEKG